LEFSLNSLLVLYACHTSVFIFLDVAGFIVFAQHWQADRQVLSLPCSIDSVIQSGKMMARFQKSHRLPFI
jgi:hypothetical protein